jgi:hypothetical protein
VGASAPGDLVLGDQLREQVELFLEQLLVLAELVAEQRKRFGERAAADDDFGAAAGDGVERREPLEHPDRIVRAQHRDRGAEPDPAGARRDRRQQHLGRGYREVGAVVLADAEEIDAELVGQHRLLDDVAQHLGVLQQHAVGAAGDVAEGIDAEFERSCHGAVLPRPRRVSQTGDAARAA